jgi:hypothetical protein
MIYRVNTRGVGGLAMSLEPLVEAVNPVVGGEILLFHAEAMTTLSIEIQ